MNTYMTEEEQIESIKKWWKRYGNLISTGVLVILLIVTGYKYWNQYQTKVKFNASMRYEFMLSALANNDESGIQAHANTLIVEYPKTVYADVAKLTLAKLAVDTSAFNKAKNYLEQVVLSKHSASIRQIARLRLSRILAMQKNYQLALSTIDVTEDKSYITMIVEQKGDIYMAQGKFGDAKKSYAKAIGLVPTLGMNNPLLKMKYNNASSATKELVNQSFKKNIGNNKLT
jgi:predicted negative regulator of RcsB-dependent stress response